MKAITLTQPWASLVAQGRKHVETRSWRTSYRGPIAIHAAKAWTAEDRGYALTLYRSGELATPSPPDQPLAPQGCVVAIAMLVSVVPTDDTLVDLPLGGSWVIGSGGLLHIDGHENSYGDFTSGRYAWLLLGVRALPEPAPARGALGLWEWEPPT